MQARNKIQHFAKNFTIFIVLLIFVLLINIPVISFEMMYPEQPILYIVNQHVTTLGDLFKIYLHPQMLNVLIPFFRPSGHFLIYQIITPFLGWHNTKGFIVVNLIFLTLTGFVLIKLYRLLFPGCKTGGYIAFSIYLMHPALTLSRLTIMHFEFANTFFSLLCLYYFILFCKSLQKVSLLTASILFYFAAATFKETALMLGPTLIVYFLIALYNGGSVTKIFSVIRKDKTIRQVFLLLFTVTGLMVIYITLQWPQLYHPLRGEVSMVQFTGPINSIIKNLTGISVNLFKQNYLPNADTAWRTIAFPKLIRMLLWGSFLIMFLISFYIFFNKSSNLFKFKKSFIFLYLASIIFLIMPLFWGMGFPWHLSLTLLFISLMIGFSIEFLLQRLLTQKNVYSITLLIAFLIGCAAFPMNKANINIYEKNQPNIFFVLQLNRNAIKNPPPIKHKLNNDSVIVVEDSFVHSAYMLGCGFYPFYLMGNINFLKFEKITNLFSTTLQPIYNGALFRFAFLMPALREEIYPFRIEQMQFVPNEIIYNWLQHANNIFCLGYDKNALWHDRTESFKANLFAEQTKRGIIVNSYTSTPANVLKGMVLYTKSLPYGDAELCQYLCDQDKKCNGFTYSNSTIANKRTIQCQFLSVIFPKQIAFNIYSTAFVKN